MFAYNNLVTEMGSLKKFAFKLTRNASEADDLLQSTLLRAMEKKHLFEDGSDLFKWASKIMFNLFVSQYRRKTRFETQYDPETYIEKEFVNPDQESKMELLKVTEAMRSLSQEHRDILSLVCINGMRYEEVAQMLQIPVGTVRSRLSRARVQLQMLMEAPSPMAEEYARQQSDLVGSVSAIAA
jgi:RNA polymerase sigma-70 factor (ECF subfamily)